MDKPQPGPGGWLGLVILLAAILVFLLVAGTRPGFFQNITPIP